MTQAIRDKAAELGNDPVRIYHWVRNQVTWLPTWGAIQDAEVTLDTRRGNAMDIASLAIALLRASGIPARYVHGTIDVPQAQFRNWIGGVADAGAAADFAASGGVPITSLVAGGQVAMLRLEHVWLEAAIDFEPSRGARNRAADTWAPLDPSFKQYLHTPALDLPALVPLDGDAILQRALTGARIDDTLGSLTGVDADAIQGAIQDYAGRVAAYLDAHPEIGGAPALTGRRTIIEQAAPMLPSSLPYQVVTEGVRWDRIPARLQHSLTLELPTAGQVRLPLARLGTRRLAIAYEPATPDDAAALDDAIASGAGALPLYLVEVKPVVRLDETPLAQGGAVAMGSDQRIDLTLSSPLGQNRLSYLRVAGDVLAVGIDPAGIDGATVARRLTAVPLATAAENLHQIALHYWQQGDLLADLAATVLGVIVQRLPSVGLFASPLEVTYNFGIPRSGHNIGRNIDIKHSVHAVYHQDPERQRAFVDLAGTIMSYLEGSILEQLMPHWQGTALSAIQSLLDANAQGIPIYRIDAANAGAILPRLGFSDAAVRQDIDTALRAGQEAIVPERIPAKPIGAQGLGLILRDPVTGAAAYRIFGGLDGGTLEPPCAEPQPQPLALSLRDQILTETVLTIVALAVAEAASGGAGAMVNSGV